MKKIFALILSLTLCFSLTGCGSPSPTKVTTTFLEAVKAQDVASVEKVYLGNSDDVNASDEIVDEDDSEEPKTETEQKLWDTINEKLFVFDYDVANEVIDGDKATVDVTITTYDLGMATTSALGEYMSQAIGLAFAGASEEQMENLSMTLFIDKISALTEKNYTKTVKVHLEKVDDQWKLSKFSDDEPIVDALSGGMQSALDNFSEAFDETEDTEIEENTEIEYDAE